MIHKCRASLMRRYTGFNFSVLACRHWHGVCASVWERGGGTGIVSQRIGFVFVIIVASHMRRLALKSFLWSHASDASVQQYGKLKHLCRGAGGLESDIMIGRHYLLTSTRFHCWKGSAALTCIITKRKENTCKHARNKHIANMFVSSVFTSVFL